MSKKSKDVLAGAELFNKVMSETSDKSNIIEDYALSQQLEWEDRALQMQEDRHLRAEDFECQCGLCKE